MYISFADLQDNLSTGDLVLFAGTRLQSKVIQSITQSQWSHIGMVLQLPDIPYPLLAESTANTNVADLYCQKIRPGVQVVPLRDRLERYPGRAAIRHLQGNRLSQQAHSKLIHRTAQLHGIEYEQDQQQLLLSAYDGPFGENEADLSSVFCSELIAELYQHIGLLCSETPSNEYTPADFSEARLKHLSNGFHLSSEIYLSTKAA